ncbi:sulfotransferase family protein [Methylophilaceae bacterium]|nr:sulfotransferase family protein [Methylophilaceae bacterium]
MIISHEHKFIFIKTAKVAGTSFEIALSKFTNSRDVLTPIYPAKDEFIRQDLFNKGPINYKLSFFDLLRFHLTYKHLKDLLRFEHPSKFYNHINAKLIKRYVSDEIWNNYTKIAIVRHPVDRLYSLYNWHKNVDKSIKEGFESYIINNPHLITDNFNQVSIDNNSVIDFWIRFEDIEMDIASLEMKLTSLKGLLQNFRMIKTKNNIVKNRKFTISQNLRNFIMDRSKFEVMNFNYK